MKAWLNNQKINLRDLGLDVLQRGFDYGDGLFETIFCKAETPVLLDYHIGRLSNGISILSNKAFSLNTAQIQDQIKDLIRENGDQENTVAKIRVWRESQFGYTPGNIEFHLLITAHETAPYSIRQVKRFGLIQSVRNQRSKISKFKTLSAIGYVLAGAEKKDKDWQEAIILDSNGLLSEGLSSNLFVLKEGHWLTPDLSTGCVGGIMRKYILEDLEDHTGTKFLVSDLHPNQENLNELPWFTINSLNMNYFLPEDQSDSPELEGVISRIRELTG